MLNKQDFTRERTKYLGGSDIGAILGFSKYRTALDVWLEKTGRIINVVDNLSVRFGSFAKSFVANEYANQTGYALVHSEAGISHPQYPFMVGHIDRIVFEGSDDVNGELFHGDGSCTASHLLECKTASPFNQSDWGELGTDEVPMSYLVQCLWYLAITNLERCDVAVLFDNSDFRIYEVYRDPELEDLIIAKEIAKTAAALELKVDELQAWVDLQAMTPSHTLLALLRIAREHHLDPSKEEVALALYDDCHWQAYITVEGYSKLLNNHPAFDGISFTQSEEVTNGIPIWMECATYRKDRGCPTVVREYFEEVKGDQAIWQKMPRRMLRHRVMQQCARLAMG